MVTTLGKVDLNSQAKQKRLFKGAFLCLVLLVIGWYQQQPTPNQVLDDAINQQRSDVWVEFDAEVIRLLPDDNTGSRHQKFIVEYDLHTILIAHNIDLALRVPVVVGDQLTIKGEYEWTKRGGVVHWTHHDPQNRHAGGWIERDGKKFK